MAIRDDLTEEVRTEYLRCIERFGETDDYAGPDTLGILDVLRAHYLIADFFYREGEGIGGIGPKDDNLLHSALYRQHVQFGGKRKWQTKFEICATLIFGLVKDHPFYDANKRTAFLSAVYYLYTQGRVPKISQKQLEDFLVDVADDQFEKFSRYKTLRKNKKVSDPEIEFIADFLKRSTRNTDKREYIITFRELKKILVRYGCDLTEPEQNFSDVIRRTKKRQLISRQIVWEEQRIMQISCPGMNREVPHGTIREIRKQAGLSSKDGIDSQEFYKAAEPMMGLIAFYREPLMSLANR